MSRAMLALALLLACATPAEAARHSTFTYTVVKDGNGQPNRELFDCSDPAGLAGSSYLGRGRKLAIKRDRKPTRSVQLDPARYAFLRCRGGREHSAAWLLVICDDPVTLTAVRLSRVAARLACG